MKSSEIRSRFLKYFIGKGHKVLPGSSLIPTDPTVLLTLAGMLQFKPIFLGVEKPKYKKVTTVQKCIRMNDIERVGKTSRHHTFFEMLGNFSFGDYFKKDAIIFAWELLTKEFGLPKDKLLIAVYEKDDEAFRFLEIWNLVFVEYNRDDKGRLLELPSKNIDTGMGLERIASVLQGVPTNFDTDLFVPILSSLNEIAKSKDDKLLQSKRIIADHIRAIVHLIADGVMPSNEGRGYVLRRIIRRAVRHGKLLSINEAFLYKLASVVAEVCGDFYTEIKSEIKSISNVIKTEEEHFSNTLQQGIDILNRLIKSGEKTIQGK
ncbi:MAG: alanine--tRNA ligase-related protein, partial [Candidatus Saganbacteria bacterium]|nr:alanine--tRNA ligase-related protein [Candidatus Saganbacteria bacterium]